MKKTLSKFREGRARIVVDELAPTTAPKPWKVSSCT
jgi:hypothetical protein